jgi:hypothetical protein
LKKRKIQPESPEVEDTLKSIATIVPEAATWKSQEAQEYLLSTSEQYFSITGKPCCRWQHRKRDSFTFYQFPPSVGTSLMQNTSLALSCHGWRTEATSHQWQHSADVYSQYDDDWWST